MRHGTFSYLVTMLEGNHYDVPIQSFQNVGEISRGQTTADLVRVMRFLLTWLKFDRAGTIC